MLDAGILGTSFRLREKPSPPREWLWMGVGAAATAEVRLVVAATAQRTKPRAAVSSAASLPLRAQRWAAGGLPGLARGADMEGMSR